MNVQILEVTNFPKELLGREIIRDKETQETYINKELYGKFANEYIQEKGLKYKKEDLISFGMFISGHDEGTIEELLDSFLMKK